MLSLDVEKVLAEVQSQAKARDQVLDGAEELLLKYPGAWYTDG